jgi:hypothetical protein
LVLLWESCWWKGYCPDQKGQALVRLQKVGLLSESAGYQRCYGLRRGDRGMIRGHGRSSEQLCTAVGLLGVQEGRRRGGGGWWKG